ncbi:MAG: S24/S26 family peptidase, partial [Desulfitobacteriaceae bacterium]
SMYPFLRDEIDSVELAKVSFKQISRGDIVMIRRTDGSYVMHRVFKKNEDCFYMVGDAQQWIEGPLYSNQLVAVVTAVWRQDMYISCSNKWWRLLSWIWLCLRPFRFHIIRVNSKVRKLLKLKSSKN